MSKVLTPKEALVALAEGKTLHREGGVYALKMEGAELVCRRDDGCHIEETRLDGWSIGEPKNPHKVGTFDWAEWEHHQGRNVKRACWISASAVWYAIDSHDPRFGISAFRATDWEVVK